MPKRKKPTEGIPGQCIGHYLASEDTCKRCILDTKCKIETQKKIDATKKEKSERAGEVDEIAIPIRIRKVYSRCLEIVDGITPYTDKKTVGDRTFFRRKVGKDLKNIVIVEMKINGNTSKWEVVVRNGKAWPRKYRVVAKTMKELNAKFNEDDLKTVVAKKKKVRE